MVRQKQGSGGYEGLELTVEMAEREKSLEGQLTELAGNHEHASSCNEERVFPVQFPGGAVETHGGCH